MNISLFYIGYALVLCTYVCTIESGMLPRQKRRGGGQIGNKITNAVYHKLTEVVENMAILTETQPLTDTTVLLVCTY